MGGRDANADGFPPRGSGVPSAFATTPLATWIHPGDLGESWRWTERSLLLGQWGDRFFGWEDDRHIVTVAGSRAGKSSTVLIPNLRRYAGSAIVLDPKGELALATAEYRRRKGHHVYVLDPFNATGLEKASHNPFDELGAVRKEDTAADAALMADALIIGNERDPHWTDAARNFIRGLSLHLIHERPQEANIAGLRRWLHADPDAFQKLLLRMAATDPNIFDGIIRNVGTSFLSKATLSPRETQSILSTAQEQTAPLDDIAKISGRSDFSLSDLKRGPVTIYLVLPGMRMGTHFRWLRLVIQQAMAAMERMETNPDDLPVLFVLEEFAALGNMRSIETAVSFMAGFGVKIWSVLQDFTQLKAHYPNSWETFLGNAGLIQAFSNLDVTTTEHLSKMLGGTQVIESQDVFVTGDQLSKGDSGRREHIRQTRLLEPSEITRYFARKTNRQLLVVPDLGPIYMNRLKPEGRET